MLYNNKIISKPTKYLKLIVVFFQVYVESIALFKCLVAKVTLIDGFVAVALIVLSQMCVHNKGLVTKLALKWSNALMYSHMDF